VNGQDTCFRASDAGRRKYQHEQKSHPDSVADLEIRRTEAGAALEASVRRTLDIVIARFVKKLFRLCPID